MTLPPSPGAPALDAELAEEWDALADRLDASPFQRPGWFAAWYPAFGRGRAQVIRCHRGGKLVGVLPVARSTGVVTSLDNAHTFRWGALAEDREAAAELVDAALGSARFRSAFGHLMAADFETVRERASALGQSTHSLVQLRSPYIEIRGEFTDYARRIAKRKLRQLERRRATLAEAGNLEIVVLDDPAEALGAVEEMFRVEAMGWKGEAGTAILSDPRTHRFYSDVCRWAAGRGILRLGFVRLDGRTIASDLMLEDAGRCYSLKTGLDPEFRATAAGLILFHDMMERSFALGHRSYEMLGDDEPYKMQWTDDAHEIHRIIAYPRSVTGRAARGAITLARRAQSARSGVKASRARTG